MPPLFVDLDGTLIRTDLLAESALALLKKSPLNVLLLLYWLLLGRARLKSEIAQRVDLDVSTLPYDAALLQRLGHERLTGRRLVLATGAHRKYAEQVAAHLGLFDAVLASDCGLNLRGSDKLSAIEGCAAGRPFDYAGNEADDIGIWQRARLALIVNAPRGLCGRLRGVEVEEIGSRPSFRPSVVLRAMRVHQWLKNLLVFVPLVAAHRVDEAGAVLQALTAFLAYGCCASSAYLLNDLLDLQSDRNHPGKRTRPLACGDLSVRQGVTLMVMLLLLASILSLALPRAFLGVLAGYYTITLGYSFWAKGKAVIDVMVLAGLYVLRVIAGAAATAISPSFWLLALSMFIFLSLALVKRYSEMLVVDHSRKTAAAGRGYVTADMPVLQSMGVASGYLSVVVVALYINSPEVRQQYAQPNMLWTICPLLLFWISRIWMKTHRNEMHHDPVVFAAKDGVSIVIGALCLLCVLAAAR